MEVVGTVLSVTQTLLSALQNPGVMEINHIFNYKSELEELQNTVSTIQAVFQDAEKKQSLSALEKKLIEDLNDAVYEANDLLDEFVTLSEQKHLIEADGRISKKMYSFFSRNNPFGDAHKMSTGVKNIRKKLDTIVGNNRFSFVHNPQPIRFRSRETSSYVNEGNIIGRGEDLKKIVGMLSDPNVQQDLSYLSIVGIGGMGKTALSQLVFNDPKVTSVFPLRFWACVSDHLRDMDVTEILGKILASVQLDQGTTLDVKQNKLRQELFGKRYLIVLDDVWTEDCQEWRDLVQHFVGGQRGSWIVATTRSQKTARIIGGMDGPMHELQGLSEADSMRLFQRTAFGPEELNQSLDDDLIKLGREIVDGCVRVPLAIKVVGSLLYGQDKSKWQLLKERGLPNIRKSEDAIMSILQLSYHHLESPLKNCFKYCALFPEDYELDKEMLIDLWIAHDYVVPLYKGQSVEEASKEYFEILLKRCFFQDIKRDELDEIVSCKMHDLIHDLAQKVSEKEIFATNIEITNFDKKVRHFSIPVKKCKNASLEKTYFHSYICIGGDDRNQIEMETSFVMSLISSCACLRVLNLAGLKMRSLPNSLSKLLHLRYLDLSNNPDLEVLPKSISELYNLQTLKLKGCSNLQKLPHDLCKLIKLRVLDIANCNELKYMPKGMEKLTCLNKLSDFIVGREGNFENWNEWFNGLEGLKALNGLKDNLRVHIKWPKNVKNVNTGDYIEKGSVLMNKHRLTCIIINFEKEEDDGRRMHMEKIIALMKDLHPPCELKILRIENYHGTRMPDWGSLLPNLVKLHIKDCSYLENWGGRRIVDSSGNNQEQEMQSQQLPCLPCLKSLIISNCKQLKWIPMCPNLKLLDLILFNGKLVIGQVGHTSASTSSQEVTNWGGPKFEGIRISNVVWLNSLHVEAFHCLKKLEIKSDNELESLGEVGEVLRSCSSSLQILKFYDCDKVRSVVGGGLEHLTALQELHLNRCKNLNLEEENEHEGFFAKLRLFLPNMEFLPNWMQFVPSPSPSPCPRPCSSLHTLHLLNLPKLDSLPNWLQFLPYLQTIRITFCGQLKAMPNWMPKLTSLRHLQIQWCSVRLARRCQQDPQGEDWPLIQHIPSIILK